MQKINQNPPCYNNTLLPNLFTSFSFFFLSSTQDWRPRTQGPRTQVSVLWSHLTAHIKPNQNKESRIKNQESSRVIIAQHSTLSSTYAICTHYSLYSCTCDTLVIVIVACICKQRNRLLTLTALTTALITAARQCLVSYMLISFIPFVTSASDLTIWQYQQTKQTTSA